VDTASYCVSEIATNAVQHVGWARLAPPHVVAVDAHWRGGLVTVAVHDPDPSLPDVSAGPVTNVGGDIAERGYGLRAVAAMAAESGGSAGARLLESGGRLVGKSVWFCLAAGGAAIASGP
jgi:hypothetical protein